MKGYDGAALASALRRLGIGPADTLMIHSALFSLGPMQDPNGGVPDAAAAAYRSIREVIGPEGTIVVPTFTFGFCHGEVFDRPKTPSVNMGVFSEYVRTLPDAHRSFHPMQSVAAIGPKAGLICAPDTPSAFDEAGPFSYLLQADAILLLLGVSLMAASILHYAEERARVPYRFWKTFEGPYVRDGQSGREQYRMFVRDLERNPQNDVAPLEAELRAGGKLRGERVGSGLVQACRCRDYVNTAIDGLRRDPYWLVRSTAKET
jgi:aminoglycoside 3-N-acetyltransferase